MNPIYLKDTVERTNREEAKRFLKDFYDQAYMDGYASNNSLGIWNSIIQASVQFTKALDVGCGVGAGFKKYREMGYEIFGCDLADASKQWVENGIEKYCRIADAKEMPYADDEFDLVVCTDVLEHVPEFDVYSTLKEIWRVGSNRYFMSVAMHQERHPFKEYIYTHITLKPEEWWLLSMKAAGFLINNVKKQPFHFVVTANKNLGYSVPGKITEIGG